MRALDDAFRQLFRERSRWPARVAGFFGSLAAASGEPEDLRDRVRGHTERKHAHNSVRNGVVFFGAENAPGEPEDGRPQYQAQRADDFAGDAGEAKAGLKGMPSVRKPWTPKATANKARKEITLRGTQSGPM
jgi:hypothetical protein